MVKKIIMIPFLVLLIFFQLPGYSYADGNGNFKVYSYDKITLLGSYDTLTDALTDSSTVDGCIIIVGAGDEIGETDITKSITLTSIGDACVLTRKSGATGNILKISPGKELTLSNIILDGNKTTVTDSTGSLVYVSANSKLYLESNSVLQNNQATTGGGLYNLGYTFINGGTIQQNTSNSTKSYGGGIYNDHSTLIMNSGSIRNNVADITTVNCSSYGGGIYNVDSTLIINGGIISSNKSASLTVNDSYGGGIYNVGSTLSINDGVISNNLAKLGAGIFSEKSATVIMHGGSIFANGNSNTINGGGFYNNLGSTFYFCGGTISNNKSGNGGGVYNNGVFYILSNTISGNSCMWQGPDTFIAPKSIVNYSKVNVRFDIQGGTYSGSILDLDNFLEQGSYASSPTASIKKSGYFFDGWFKESTFLNKWDFATDKVTANTILYANWVDRSLVSIAVTTPPEKLVYIEGTDFSSAGMMVTASYDNEEQTVVTGYTISPITLNSVGTQPITITYTEDSVTKSTDIPVTVIPSTQPPTVVPPTQPPTVVPPIQSPTTKLKILTGISVTTLPQKLSYIKGTSFSSMGMVVTASYDNGEQVEVTGYTISPTTLNSVGTQAVTISYTEGNVTKSADISVTVIPPTQTTTVTPQTTPNLVGTQTTTGRHTEDNVTKSADISNTGITKTLANADVTTPQETINANTDSTKPVIPAAIMFSIFLLIILAGLIYIIFKKNKHSH